MRFVVFVVIGGVEEFLASVVVFVQEELVFAGFKRKNRESFREALFFFFFFFNGSRNCWWSFSRGSW